MTFKNNHLRTFEVKQVHEIKGYRMRKFLSSHGRCLSDLEIEESTDYDDRRDLSDTDDS